MIRTERTDLARVHGCEQLQGVCELESVRGALKVVYCVYILYVLSFRVADFRVNYYQFLHL